jgi:phenylalanyl-tRNA synthetase beta chain
MPGLEKFNPEDLADQLTMAGLEVEASESFAARLKGVIVGHVDTLEKHPQADKLSVCQVTIGAKSVQVVCGAANVASGKKYPFVGVGAVLSNGMEIKPVKLRGVESFGMLCSEKELGLSDASEGIMELDTEAPAGSTLVEALTLDDTILEVNITPNRGDALSHWGVAKDIAALTGLKVDFDCVIPKDISLNLENKEALSATINLTHSDHKACGRFTASEIKNVTIAPSPTWLKTRLESLDIRSINNVVDATNYVLLLTGHPVHAYDAANIAGGEIKIYSLENKTKYKTLDGVERSLCANDLIIGDADGLVGLAGIMGGENSEIKNETKDLILEVAFFDPDTIRGTSRRLELQTESSYRFARFVNPETVLRAHEILRDLILILAGGQASNVVDSYPQPFKRISIELPHQEIKRILGIVVPREEIIRILTGLDCTVSEDEKGYVIEPPIARSDLTRSIDLIEEIARVYGLDKIPAQMPRIKTHFPQESQASRSQYAVKDYMVHRGFHETLHYSFFEPTFLNKILKEENPQDWITLQNALSEDLAVMRPSLLPHLIKAYQKNHLLSQKGLRFFELRNVYHYEEKKQIKETLTLSFLYAGNPFGRNRFELGRDADFFDGRGILEGLFQKAGICCDIKKHKEWPYHPGQCIAFSHNDTSLAFVGALHPQLLSELKIREQVYFGELNYDLYSALSQSDPVRYQPISVLPSVYRDLSLVVSKDLSYESILDVIEEEKPDNLTAYNLFALYTGENLGDDKKSLTFSMIYEPKEKSLTDEEVNAVHFALVEKLQKRLGVSLR